MAARKKAVAKRGGTAMSAFQSRLDAARERFGNRERDPSGNKLSIRGSKFTLDGNNLGTELEVVVLDYSMFNAYYTTAFDPDTPAPPVCFAISRIQDDLAPVAGCSEPQSESCTGCWANEYGSAQQGKGKACGNKRRVALLRAETVDDALANGTEIGVEDIAVIEFGGTSLGSWTTYVNKVSKRLNLPPFSVRTLLSFDESSNWPKVEFAILPEQIEYDDKTLEAVLDLIDAYDESLMAIPNLTLSDEDDHPAKASRAAPQASRAKKKATAKKAAARRSRLA